MASDRAIAQAFREMSYLVPQRTWAAIIERAAEIDATPQAPAAVAGEGEAVVAPTCGTCGAVIRPDVLTGTACDCTPAAVACEGDSLRELAEALTLPDGYAVVEFLPGQWSYEYDRDDGERMASGTNWNHPALAACAAWESYADDIDHGIARPAADKADEFERWARPRFTKTAEAFDRIEGRPGGWEYNGDAVQTAWAAWQAALAKQAAHTEGE